MFLDRFAFGVVAGVLVIATGGLEAGIAYHVLNNLLAFGIALFFGDMTSALNPSGGTWWDVVVSFVKSAIFVVLSIWVARRMGVADPHRSQAFWRPPQPACNVSPRFTKRSKVRQESQTEVSQWDMV